MMALKHHGRGASSRVPWTRNFAQAAIPARAEGCENMKPRQPFRGWRGYALWKRPGEALSSRHTARSASTGESSAGPILRSDPSAYRRSRFFQVAVWWRHVGFGASCELLHIEAPVPLPEDRKLFLDPSLPALCSLDLRGTRTACS